MQNSLTQTPKHPTLKTLKNDNKNDHQIDIDAHHNAKYKGNEKSKDTEKSKAYEKSKDNKKDNTNVNEKHPQNVYENPQKINISNSLNPYTDRNNGNVYEFYKNIIYENKRNDKFAMQKAQKQTKLQQKSQKQRKIQQKQRKNQQKQRKYQYFEDEKEFQFDGQKPLETKQKNSQRKMEIGSKKMKRFQTLNSFYEKNNEESTEIQSNAFIEICEGEKLWASVQQQQRINRVDSSNKTKQQSTGKKYDRITRQNSQKKEISRKITNYFQKERISQREEALLEQNKQLRETIAELKMLQMYKIDSQKVKQLILDLQTLKNEIEKLKKQNQTLKIQNDFLKRTNNRMKQCGFQEKKISKNLDLQSYQLSSILKDMKKSGKYDQNYQIFGKTQRKQTLSRSKSQSVNHFFSKKSQRDQKYHKHYDNSKSNSKEHLQFTLQ